jgi:CDP-glucose 4,6-dehydratase
LRRCDLSLLTSAFNFGPDRDAHRCVAELVEEVLRHWPGRWEDKTDPKAPHEAGWLQLSTDKAYGLLRWFPIWPFAEAVEKTVEWYRGATRAKAASQIPKRTRAQIAQYIEDAGRAGAPWTQSVAAP